MKSKTAYQAYMYGLAQQHGMSIAEALEIP